ncbi:hypothetical protein [Paenarthrobacter aurescens]|uniref:hypothetical protein n=1 Tax=Paenarthrobacter aurescens TaxID=43663 RepID=UPI0021C0BFCD|nr:hypothetical protein [Paenarthrobacter aurescens]MCT9868745.1 hypothetical protein [Paenarthrobacter aurescens]
MITVEGAKLLAALIPVLVLILAVERRAMGPAQRPVYFMGWVWFWILGVLQFLGIAGSIIGLMPLFLAVNENRNVDTDWAVIVLLCSAVLVIAVALVAMELAMRAYLGGELMDVGARLQRERRVDAYLTERARRARKIAVRRLAARGRGREPLKVPVRPR